MRRLAILALFSIFCSPGFAAGDVLQSLQQSGKLKIGYRTDAPPFSYRNEIGEPAGYTVNLCRAVAAIIGKHLKRPVSLAYVPVTAEDRFDAVRSGKIDLLCGATTETLSRRKLVAFSVATFVTGASVIYHSDGPGTFKELAGRKIGVTAGTTTEKDLMATLQKLSIDAQVVRFSNHDAGLKGLKTREADAYFGDRTILAALLRNAPDHSAGLVLSDRHFSVEPYALAMPLGSDRFRDEVDRALSHVYRSGEVVAIYRNSFGNAEPSNFVKALIVINALAD